MSLNDKSFLRPGSLAPIARDPARARTQPFGRTPWVTPRLGRRFSGGDFAHTIISRGSIACRRRRGLRATAGCTRPAAVPMTAHARGTHEVDSPWERTAWRRLRTRCTRCARRGRPCPIPGTGCERSGATAYSLRSGNVTERAVSHMCERGGGWPRLVRPSLVPATDTVRTAPIRPPPLPPSPLPPRGEARRAKDSTPTSPDRPSAWSGAYRAPCPWCGLSVRRDNLSRHLKRCAPSGGASA